MKNHSGKSNPRTLLGMGLIILAVLLFFKNIGFSFFGILFNNWPLALIAVGVLLQWGPEKMRQQPRSPAPIAMMGVGVLFILAQHNIFNLNFGAVFVPLIFIFVGMHVLKPHKPRICRKSGVSEDSELTQENFPDSDGEGKIDIFTVLGGGNYVTRAQNLQSGNVMCILGGADIDIREADCLGDTIEVDVLALMGGVNIKIPPHWQVTVNILPLLGGVTNKTTCLADKMGIAKKNLVITGIAFMGGIEIRN